MDEEIVNFLSLSKTNKATRLGHKPQRTNLHEHVSQHMPLFLGNSMFTLM